MIRIAVIGGGITGLAAAYALEKQSNAGVGYMLYESSSRLGGVLQSEIVDNCLIEAGPDSFLTEKPWATALCREIGLGDDIIYSNDAHRKTYILVNGKLVEMPDGLMFMVPTKLMPTALSPLFSLGTKFRMLRELLHSPRPMQGDETVAQMVERHFGREVVDRLADPLLAGVYGGDTRRLSARAVLPRFVEMEQRYGSLSKAMVAASKKMNAASARRLPLFSSVRGGMQRMADALIAHLNPDSLSINAVAVTIDQLRNGWSVQLADGSSEDFDGVILATPANVAGILLSGVDAALSADLQAIPYSSSITVNRIYDRKDLERLPPGFGFLVPRTEGKRMLACTFVHNKFPDRAPQEYGILRCFLGGSNDEAVLKLSDAEALAIVHDELRSILGLTAEPRTQRIHRWRSSMAQYESGHLERLQRIEGAVAKKRGLALAGNGYRGVGVPDCVRSGSTAVASVLGLENGAREGNPALFESAE